MKLCPLCGKELKDWNSAIVRLYCPTLVKQPNCESAFYHYSKGHSATIVHLPPYRLINEGEFSYIDTFIDDDSYGYKIDTIITVPLIHLDTEENLRKRLKTILLFS